jgi:hypothetical protein
MRDFGRGTAGWAAAAVMAVALGTAAAVRAEAGAPVRDAAVAAPLAQYTTHVVAVHFRRGERYETHHYFKPLREGVLQGLVFRQAAEGAPLIEVEWAISADVYAALPDWQKELWHPLLPAVDAGRVTLPDTPADRQRETLAAVRGLYAQTLNLAGTGGELPVGVEGVTSVTHLTRAEMGGAHAR